MSKIAFFCIPAHGHTNPTLEVVKFRIEQNRCAMAYQGCGAVFLFFQK